MSQINTRELVLLPQSTLTTSGTGNDQVVLQGWQAAIISVSANTVSGTSPTFDVYIQRKLGQAAATDLSGNPPTGTAIYDDLLHFSQLTTTAVRIANLCTGPLTPSANTTIVTSADYLQADAALTAGDIRIGPLGGLWRVKYVVGGTSPSAVVSVCVQLIPFGT